MLKERIITLYTRSRINTMVWGLSFVFVTAYTIASAFLGNWFFFAAGLAGAALPFFLRNVLIRYYYLTKIFFRYSGPLILAAILLIPFTFGSLPHIPLPLRVAGFFYVTFYSSSFFWVVSDPTLFIPEEH